MLSAIPAGNYYLNVEAELPPGSATVTSTFTVFRDVPGWTNFLLALLGLLVLPLGFRWRVWAYERARWAESDYGPSSKGEANEGDDE